MSCPIYLSKIKNVSSHVPCPWLCQLGVPGAPGSRAERAAFLISVFEDKSLIIGARLKAADMLNRMYGDYMSDTVLSEREARLPTLNIVYAEDIEK